MTATKTNRRTWIFGVATMVATLPNLLREGLATGPVVHDVKIKSFQFEPSHLVVNVGDQIRWTNEDLAPHTATSNDGSWDTGELTRGSSQTILVTKGMTGSYFCAFHPHMKGVIEVV